MSNKGILNLTLKSHPPPKKESIIRVKTFLEYRRKQKEEEEEDLVLYIIVLKFLEEKDM